MARRKSSEKSNQSQKLSNLKLKNKANSDDENFTCFKDQLKAMGLTLREIQGDGNCLFRALNDQLEGHTRNHLKYRYETVQYMKEHRNDFEPFVEDDVPFDQHLYNLGQPGTYAGNDAIVAFARLHELVIVIHQLNTPLWQVKGTDKPNAVELHLSYHNGDHYNSVRKIGDNTQSPACIRLAAPRAEKQQDPSRKDVPSEQTAAQLEEQVMLETGVQDLQLIREVLQDYDFSKQGAVDYIRSQRTACPDKAVELNEEVESIWSTEETGARILGDAAVVAVATIAPRNGVSEDADETKTRTDSASGPKKRLSAKAKKELKKLERKHKNVQRKKGDSNTVKSRNELEDKTADIIVADFKYLTI
ncbi:putative OTU domain-containing protein [Ixodes scapularis]|uniref:OTU domain-containing protein 3 n=1 Tax=Ixodes scapularis TaxID=6945 RepID=B7PDT5_IXOSC|nr:OTU domain-containing protein, putative [Ixodes scapularis]|eukprot:XP_002399244.1 OTU domain-containing protein, putative [Ixodes scapularis]